MLLVDTSVWVDHLRLGDEVLASALGRAEVMIHPFVLGEIALGNLANRALVLASLADLPRAVVATEDEVLAFIGGGQLHGRGIGYVDAHLLASTRLTPDVSLWTRDRRLLEAAVALGLSAGA